MASNLLTLLEVIPGKILTAIKTMSDKQQKKRPICLDSISLVVGLSVKDIIPVIEHLQTEGFIIIYKNNKTVSKRLIKPDSVLLVDESTHERSE